MRSSREESIGSSAASAAGLSARWRDDGVSEKKVRGGRLVGVEFVVSNPR
jgi:hypothetical protein